LAKKSLARMLHVKKERGDVDKLPLSSMTRKKWLQTQRMAVFVPKEQDARMMLMPPDDINNKNGEGYL
jgi:hypothetical protein